MGKTVRRLWPFMRMDYKAAEEYLEKKAAQGLVLKAIEIGSFSPGNFYTASYEKVPPQQRKYCIDAFSGSEEEAKDYLQMAEDAGWEPVAEVSGNIIFTSRRGETPIPMQTDWQNEYRQIRKGFWKFEFPVAIMLLITIWFLGGLRSDVIRTIGQAIREFYFPALAVVICCVFILIGAVWGILFYLKSEIAIRRGVPLRARPMKTALAWGTIYWGMGFIGAIGIFAQFQVLIIQDALAADTFSKITYGLCDGALLTLILLGIFKSDCESKGMAHLVKVLWIIFLISGVILISRGCTFE